MTILGIIGCLVILGHIFYSEAKCPKGGLHYFENNQCQKCMLTNPLTHGKIHNNHE
jgi:hypothetical protein